MNIEPITVHTSRACCWNSMGPGVRPLIISVPSRMASAGVVGMPSDSSGMKPAMAVALLAASGAATPSIMPVPNFSGVREICRSTS